MLCYDVQLSCTSELDGVMRQCDVIDMAQASRGHPKSSEHSAAPQRQQAPSALDSRAGEIGRDYFRHLSNLLAQLDEMH